MAAVVAADVVVPLKLAAVAETAFAHVPVARGFDAVDERAVVQNRQVEAAAVPAHQLRRVAFHQLEKAGDDGFFIVADVADGADVDFVLPPAHAAGNRYHAVQVQRHKVAAGFGAAFLLRPFHDLRVGQIGGQAVQQADAVRVGHGFDVEGEDGDHMAHSFCRVC